jgi:hypothetical protein
MLIARSKSKSRVCRRRLFDAMSSLILPRPNTGQQRPTTTGPLRRIHLTDRNRNQATQFSITTVESEAPQRSSIDLSQETSANPRRAFR